MSCAGLHCSGCAGGVTVPPVAFAVLYGFAWVLDHLLEVAVVSAACGALAVAAVVALMRWGSRRDERQRAAASIWTVRTEVIDSGAQRAAVGPAGRAALPFRDVHIHLDGQPTAEQAEVIRRALGQ